MPNNNRNRNEVPAAKKALDKLKIEVANELGIADYDKIDKGNLTARQNGYIGGNMVRRMIKYAEQQMENGNADAISSAVNKAEIDSDKQGINQVLH